MGIPTNEDGEIQSLEVEDLPFIKQEEQEEEHQKAIQMMAEFLQMEKDKENNSEMEIEQQQPQEQAAPQNQSIRQPNQSLFHGLLYFDPLDEKITAGGYIKFGFELDIESGKANVVDAGITLASLLPDVPDGAIAEYGNVCKYFLKGTCQKGNACSFRHVRSREAVLCKHWLNGLCKKGPKCEFLHQLDLQKMPVCQFFAKGECLREDCLFRHISPKDNMKECAWYARGFCKHGPRCRNKHSRKHPCPKYLLGFCPDGPRCKFGHSKFELPMEDKTAPPPMDEAQMFGNRSRSSQISCKICGGQGHPSSQCPQEANSSFPPGTRRPLEEVTCFKCGEKGHYANRCPQSAFSKHREFMDMMGIPTNQKQQQAKPIQSFQG